MSDNGFGPLIDCFQRHGIDENRLGLIRLAYRLKAPEGDDSVWVELTNPNETTVELGVVLVDRDSVELLMLKPFEPGERLAFPTRISGRQLIYMVEVKPCV